MVRYLFNQELDFLAVAETKKVWGGVRYELGNRKDFVDIKFEKIFIGTEAVDNALVDLGIEMKVWGKCASTWVSDIHEMM